MKNTTVETIGYMGKPWTISGDVESGLIVHKMGKSWMVTHIKTGLKIGPGCRLKNDAMAKRARLLDILPDWKAESVALLAKDSGNEHFEFARLIRVAAYGESV